MIYLLCAAASDRQERRKQNRRNIKNQRSWGRIRRQRKTRKSRKTRSQRKIRRRKPRRRRRKTRNNRQVLDEYSFPVLKIVCTYRLGTLLHGFPIMGTLLMDPELVTKSTENVLLFISSQSTSMVILILSIHLTVRGNLKDNQLNYFSNAALNLGRTRGRFIASASASHY